MGQQAQNGGRNASLDQQKRRAAGRAKTNAPEREAIKDAVDHKPHQPGATGGAFGKHGRANRRGPGNPGEGSGGGGANPTMRIAGAGRSTRPARKRGSSASARGR